MFKLVLKSNNNDFYKNNKYKLKTKKSKTMIMMKMTI